MDLRDARTDEGGGEPISMETLKPEYRHLHEGELVL